MSIKPDELSAAIAEELQAFQGATDEALRAAINETAEAAAQVVKAKAQHFGSNYANDITAETVRKILNHQGAAYVTGGDHYRVAHLLEHGHALIRGGRKIGDDVKGFEHFADGERYTEDHLVENIRKEIEG